MAECLGAMRIAPDAFWRLTMHELRAIIGARAGRGEGPAMKKSDLDDLMTRFPDPITNSPITT